MKPKCEFCSKVFADDERLKMHKIAQHPNAGYVPSGSELDQVARSVLYDFLTSDGHNPGLLQKAKQANTFRSTEAKREQTQSAKEATLVMMARELAENKGEFRRFIRAALPGSPMLKLAEKNQNENEKAS